VITACVALAVVAIPLVPGGTRWLQFDRLAISDGQWWRMLTGHLTHWNLDHLVWDLLMFVVLGTIVEKLSRTRFVLLCLVSALSISLMVLLGQPDLSTYRGLSGIDTALFVYLACVQLANAWHQRRWAQGLLFTALLTGFGGKLFYELVFDRTLFVDSETAGFVVVVMAHAVGAAVGASLGVALVHHVPGQTVPRRRGDWLIMRPIRQSHAFADQTPGSLPVVVAVSVHDQYSKITSCPPASTAAAGQIHRT
jgi:rhomboid family GlyGly-CTERM serine protease